MLDRIEFLLTEAFTSLRRNTWMTFSAVTTSAMALLLIGGLGLAYMGIMRFAESLPSKLEMRVMMQMDLPDEQIGEIGLKIRAIPEVARVEFIPKETAWDEMREKYPDVTEGMDNVMPDAYRVTMRRVGDADLVAAKIGEIPGQDGVEYMRKEYNLIDQAVSLIRLVGLGLGGLMLLTGGILIFNSIRLTIVARRKEMLIMQLVGAARSTIRVPLLIEGMIQGTLGGVVASLLLWPAYEVVQSLGKTLAFLSESAAAYPAMGVFFSLSGIGAVYGLICSAIAVREPRMAR